MKLTNNDREAFVRAVMDDVPQVDYVQQAYDVAEPAMRENLPPIIREVWDDPETRKYLSLPGVYIGSSIGALYFPRGAKFHAVADTISALEKASRAQDSARSGMRESLKTAIKGCATLKQARELLPEFEKYLPADRGASGLKNLPAVTGLVVALTAAGWPKDAAKTKGTQQ